MAAGYRVGLERAKSAALVVLVGMSLVLTVSQPMGGGGPAEKTVRPYVAEGNHASADLAQLLAPRRLILYRPDGPARLVGPGTAAFVPLWQAVRAAVMDALEAGKPAPVSVDPAEIDRWRRNAGGIEAVLPAELALDEWHAVWRGGSRRDGSARPGVRRAAVFPLQDGGVAVYLGGGGGWSRLAGGGGAALAEALRRAAGEGVPATELQGRRGRLQVLPGIYIPAGDVYAAPVVRTGEPLDRRRLESSFFPDDAVVRRIPGQSGASYATDGRGGLIVYPDGALVFNRPSVPEGGADKGALAALAGAAEFVAFHGGWPEGARLITAERQSGPAGGYRLGFACTYRGLPVVGGLESALLPGQAAGVSAPIGVLTTPEGRLRGFSRAVPRPVAEDAPKRLIPPQDALSRLDAVWERFAGRDNAVRDIFPVYFFDRSGGVMRPAWLIELSSGLQVAVDGLTGRVYSSGAAGGG